MGQSLKLFAPMIRILIFLLLISFAFFSTGNAFQSIESDTAGIKYGYVQFKIEPDTAYIYLGTNFNDPILVTNGTKLKLTPGDHHILVFGKSIPDSRYKFYLEENSVKDIVIHEPTSIKNSEDYSTYAALKWDANLMVFSDEETFISISDTEFSSQGFLKAKLPAGVYRIRLEDNSGRVKEEMVELNTYLLYSMT